MQLFQSSVFRTHNKVALRQSLCGSRADGRAGLVRGGHIATTELTAAQREGHGTRRSGGRFSLLSLSGTVTQPACAFSPVIANARRGRMTVREEVVELAASRPTKVARASWHGCLSSSRVFGALPLPICQQPWGKLT